MRRSFLAALALALVPMAAAGATTITTGRLRVRAGEFFRCEVLNVSKRDLTDVTARVISSGSGNVENSVTRGVLPTGTARSVYAVTPSPGVTFGF